MTTARLSGLLYLILGIAGGVGFLAIRPAIVVPDDATTTLANLLANESLARIGIGLELVTVLAQSVLAVTLFHLFRKVNTTAATALAGFALVNAVAILASAALSTGALEVGLADASTDNAAATVHLLYGLGGIFWGVGGLFFGLWLIPMGMLVLESRWMPRPLGWILIAGGFGYILSVFAIYVVPAPEIVSTVLTLVATVGEFWMIGYLLILGIRPRVAEPVAA